VKHWPIFVTDHRNEHPTYEVSEVMPRRRYARSRSA
jgi:hypothetical protein